MKFICKIIYPKIESFLSIIEKEFHNKKIFYTNYSFSYRVHPSYDDVNYNELETSLLDFGNNNQQNELETSLLDFENNNQQNDLETILLDFENNNQLNHINHYHHDPDDEDDDDLDGDDDDDLYIKVWNYKLSRSLFVIYGNNEESKWEI